MACPEGQYYCHDRGKCMPIPKGKKVRKDGELVTLCRIKAVNQVDIERASQRGGIDNIQMVIPNPQYGSGQFDPQLAIAGLRQCLDRGRTGR